MQRIMVMGVSAGAGKSTLARKVGDRLGIDVYHLDTFYWKPGWVEASEEEFAGKQKEVVKQDEWIMEGNYSGTYEIRAEHADTIIYVELPLSICLYRVVKRWWNNRGKTRSDLGTGCEEKLDFEFLKFIVTTYHRRKQRMRIRFREFQKKDPSLNVIVLRSKKDVTNFEHYLKTAE